jgi:hypothetical protein
LLWDDKEGAWDAAVGIHLEPAKNAFPKTEFIFPLKFKLHDGDIDLEIRPDGKFQMQIDDPASWQPAFEHAISTLARTLNLKPWDAAQEQIEKIGFIWFEKD